MPDSEELMRPFNHRLSAKVYYWAQFKNQLGHWHWHIIDDVTGHKQAQGKEPDMDKAFAEAKKHFKALIGDVPQTAGEAE